MATCTPETQAHEITWDASLSPILNSMASASLCSLCEELASHTQQLDVIAPAWKTPRTQKRSGNEVKNLKIPSFESKCKKGLFKNPLLIQNLGQPSDSSIGLQH